MPVLEAVPTPWGPLNLFGDAHLVSSTVFDIGVYLVVIGMVLDLVRSLGSGIDEQAAEHRTPLPRPDSTRAVPAAERDALGMMLEHKVRGILYSTWNHRATEIPDALAEADHVLVNCYTAGTATRAVVPDEVGGGRTATDLLLAQGHRRIAFVNTTSPSPAREGRLQGYREAHAAVGAEVDEALILDASPEQEGGYAVAEQLLALGVTGVFCHNDRVAMGLYDALRERGLRVPGDMAVVGFDNQEVIAGHLRPPLSTVALPHYELGVRGVRVLLGAEELAPGEQLRVSCPVVARDSIAAR